MSIIFRRGSKPRLAIADVFRYITEHVLILLAVYLVSWILGAYMISSIEGWRLIDGLWWANVASLTIGYGDIAPKTDLGRILAMIFHFAWALYLILCIAAHLVKFMFRDRNEMTHEEQEWLFDRAREQSQMLIALAKNQEKLGCQKGIALDMSAFKNADGTFRTCPSQPSDTSHGDVEPAETSILTPN